MSDLPARRGYVMRPTRRREREQAHIDLLDKVRADLWVDLAIQLELAPYASPTRRLVDRIREIGYHLGRPTPSVNVPVVWLRWYDQIEEVPDMGLWPEPWPSDAWRELLLRPVDDDAIALYNRNLDMGDLDDET